MLISVVCPRCKTSYQVQDTLEGKAMRCPNALCRTAFIVEKSKPQQPPQQTGSVGEVIPLLPVEPASTPSKHVTNALEFVPAETATPDLPLERPAWMNPPPVRRGAETPTAKDEPAQNKKATTKKNGEPRPAVQEGGTWEAPPVRRGREVEETVQLPPDGPHEKEPAEQHEEQKHVYDDEHHPRGRWAKRLILSFVVLVLAGLGGGVGFYLWVDSQREDKIAAKADEAYADGQFNTAGQLYRRLAEKFPDSEAHGRYAFRADFSELRYKMVEPPEDIRPLLGEFRAFLEDKQKDPQLPEHGVDVQTAVIKLLTDYAGRVAGSLGDDSPNQELDLALDTIGKEEGREKAGPAVRLAREIKLPKGAKAPDWTPAREAVATLRGKIARAKRFQGVLARLEELSGHGSYPALLHFETTLRDAGAEFGDLGQSARVQGLREKLTQKHLESVRFVEEPPQIPETGRGEDALPAILLDPLVSGTPGAGTGDNKIVLALVRGVLYALRQSTGRIQWAVRVGIDTTALPVKVAARAGISERLLVLSSDTSTLTAYVADNERPLWTYRLGTPVLGSPVVVDQRAYLSTYSGEIHEVELLQGRLLGRYTIGQPLTRGGTLEPGSRRVYFPADQGCVYVIDVGKRQCERILYSRHPSGSLRSPPIVLPPEKSDRGGYLILNQATGLDQTHLRVFDLPLASAAAERTVNPQPSLPGWSWFRPYHDPEKLVLLSDAGTLGLFGIRQPNNRDQALFPFLPKSEIDLAADLGVPKGANSRGRAEIVQVEGDDFWVLASGRLRRLRLGWRQDVGPKITPAWKSSLVVGAPIHATQVVEDIQGDTNLIVVTQPERRSCAWVQNISDEDGKIHWRRQLGAVCSTEPVPLPLPNGGKVWLLCDQSGALFTVHPLPKGAVQPGTSFVTSGKNVLLDEPLKDGADTPPVLLRNPETGSVHVLGFPGDGRTLFVRTVTPPSEGTRLQVRRGKVNLASRAAGRPVLSGNQLVVPLADGNLVRVSLPLPEDNATAEAGPPWRADRAAEDSECPMVELPDGRLVTGDGLRGLTAWEWKAGNPRYKKLPVEGSDEPTLELPNRVTGLARLPGKVGEGVHLVAADSAAAGRLTLIDVLATGAMRVRRTWELDGPITEPPLVLQTPAGVRVVCVVERTGLVLIDPQAARPVWRWTSPGKDPLVGVPQVVGNLLAVTDQAGVYVGIDLKTGKAAGTGYTLSGSIAPVTSPVPYSDGRLLAPLSDGTILLLAADRLGK